ncbi:unnamed protein product, partial [marine sediment metagenome]
MKSYGRVAIVCVLCFALLSAFAPVGQAGGIVEAIGIALAKEIADAILEKSDAIAYAKAKTGGPDGDDKAIKSNDDENSFFTETELDADTGAVIASNGIGGDHYARIHIHWDWTSFGGSETWRPDPENEFGGYVQAWPDDDPVKPRDTTYAAAAAAFSESGRTDDYCYSAGVESIPGSGRKWKGVEAVRCSPIAEFALSEGAILLVSVERFSFTPTPPGPDLVQIAPLFNDPIDLFHSYLQETANLTVLPLLRGHDVIVQ